MEINAKGNIRYYVIGVSWEKINHALKVTRESFKINFYFLK